MEAIPEKQHAHELIDRLPSSQITTAIRFLEFMLLDPLERTVALAPADYEPVTGEDRRRIKDGESWFAQHGGTGVPMDDVLADFGVKPEDFQHSPEDSH